MGSQPQSENSPFKREGVSPLFQTLLILGSSFILVTGFYLRGTFFRTADEPIVHQTITPDTLKKFGGFPEYISVGLHIDRFQDFDVTKNLFQFTGNLWFEFKRGGGMR